MTKALDLSEHENVAQSQYYLSAAKRSDRSEYYFV